MISDVGETLKSRPVLWSYWGFCLIGVCATVNTFLVIPRRFLGYYWGTAPEHKMMLDVLLAPFPTYNTYATYGYKTVMQKT